MNKLLTTIFFLGVCFTTNAIAEPYMSDSEKQGYLDWVKENLNRYDNTSDIALAMAPNGCWAVGYDKDSVPAKRLAIKNCKKRCKASSCEIVDLNGRSDFIRQRGSAGSSSPTSSDQTINYSDGGKYVGDVSNGALHGQGTMTWANGDKYVGEWKDNKKHGQGTETYPDGSKYVGEFKDNKYHGQGTLTWANGTKYVGEWKDRKMHGHGTLTWPNGKKFVGESKEGKMWDGVYYFASGEIIRTYSNGQSSSSSSSSTSSSSSSTAFEQGKAYRTGEGVEKNYKEAVKWYKEVVDENSYAPFWIGMIYNEGGYGITKNEGEAFQWFIKGADMGGVGSQFMLGLCYEYGIGVSQNLEKAVSWYRKSAEQGDQTSKDALKRLDKKSGPSSSSSSASTSSSSSGGVAYCLSKKYRRFLYIKMSGGCSSNELNVGLAEYDLYMGCLVKMNLAPASVEITTEQASELNQCLEEAGSSLVKTKSKTTSNTTGGRDE